MAGRNGQPIDLVVAKGKKHLTKAEIQHRKENEIKLGENDLGKLVPPSFVKDDVIAYSCWKQSIEEYKEAQQQGIEILSSSDAGLLALYCKTFSEYETLLGYTADDLELEMKRQTAINKKMDMLIKMQDRLFLNPLAKVKNVARPKVEEKTTRTSKFGKFGMDRGR